MSDQGVSAEDRRAPDGETRPPAWRPENRRRANRNLLDTLAALWDQYPDQRFGQLVMNLSRTPDGFADTWEWKHGAWLDRIGETAEQLDHTRNEAVKSLTIGQRSA